MWPAGVVASVFLDEKGIFQELCRVLRTHKNLYGVKYFGHLTNVNESWRQSVEHRLRDEVKENSSLEIRASSIRRCCLGYGVVL